VIRFKSLTLENFHLARHLVIPFSTDPDRPLSIIRAEPGTGKTTVFRAFRWALYDDAGLPNGGRGYPLASMNHDPARDGRSVGVSAMLDFEVTGSGLPTSYRLKRSVTEDVDEAGRHTRGHADLTLMKEGAHGWTAVDHPEVTLERFFPHDLRDVFFTDGDEAMRFIARDVATSTKRERVRGAIRNLLGIAILEEAERHLDQVQKGFNADVRSRGGNASLKDASDKVEQATELLAQAQDLQKQLLKEHELVDEARSVARQRLDAALQRGNKPELVRQRQEAEATQTSDESEIKGINREKSDLLRQRLVATPFLAEILGRARLRLATLKDEGRIPSNYLPLLRERLDSGRCVCGTELTPGSPHRAEVERLLADQENTSEIKDRLTALFYTVRDLQEDASLSQRLGRLEERALRAQNSYSAAGARIAAIELQIRQLGDVDVEALQAAYIDNDGQLRKLTAQLGMAEADVLNKTRDKSEAEKRRDKLLESAKDAKNLQAKLQVASDLMAVIEGAKKRIQEEKVREVSDEMNKLFRTMIGASTDDAVIKRAEITTDCDVLVYSQTDARMDPDLQLNGASRRAITLAFILALAKISGSSEPNVIDTPLGMMGIQVKQAALDTLIRESAQPVLFLTYAEIRDIEDALDVHAGSTVTLTMTGHYPTYLKNKPPVDGAEILACGCNHRGHCELCERVFTTADQEQAA
jgi:DNA sulfur modification protein DndD